MNLPNMLTLFRLFLIPIFVLVFFSNSPNSLKYSILVFLLAGFTDILDGYIARTYNLITKWGTAVDPLADKLMLITVLTCFLLKNYIPFWVLVIMAVKEFSMIICGVILYQNNNVISSNIFGKLATCLFYISIFLIAFYKSIGMILIYIAVFSSLIAYINYFLAYYKSKQKL